MRNAAMPPVTGSPRLTQRTLSAARGLGPWIVFEAPVEALEVWTGMNALLWGLWVLNPWMDVFSTVPGFATMALIPEWIWGAVMVAVSVTQLAGRLLNRPDLQRFGARGIAMEWLFVAGALVYQNWRWPAVVLYPMLALASLLVSYRAEPLPRHASPDLSRAHERAV